MDYLLHLVVVTGIYSILSLSLNLVVGYTGLPALGHAVFASIGGYTSALLVVHTGLPPVLALVAGALAASAFAYVLGVPTVRLEGDYFALATFGAGVVVYSIANTWTDLTGGGTGLSGIPVFSVAGLSFSSVRSYAALVAVATAVTALVVSRVAHSPFGRILRSIREDELASRALGNDVAAYKLWAFLIGAFFAGVAGSLYAHYVTFFDPATFSVMESIIVLLMVVFGGMGSIRGSFAGAALLILLPEGLRFLDLPSAMASPLRQMLYGLLLVVVMRLRPRGVFGTFDFGT